jgi:antibiotic biosynthesis monooxygenase (ABM) superfamily enzyme
MTAKIQKSSDLGEIWYYYRHDRVKNWALIISYQNMPNLHNWYKSTERKISHKNPEYMLKYWLL